ncbi:hypothetical protein JCM5296_002949 [Sporobolomyces johnsonii]
MAPPTRFKGGGGKKGPRQVSSRRQPKMTLRPAPERPSKGAGANEEDQGEEEEEDEEDGEEQQQQYDHLKALQGERKPLEGWRVTVSGCSGHKEDLLKMAEEYGAERHAGLQEDTTHLVTDHPGGAKYKIALERRMHVMLPSWLPAIREAWMSGNEVNYDEIERQHTMQPLYGVVATLTEFARGEHKDDFKYCLLAAGAQLVSTLDDSVTHLIVASPSSPHSQTPSSDKLLHARKHRERLHPDFQVVWEGWAREAIKFGGRREARDKAWEWRKDAFEPEENVEWAVRAPPRRRLLDAPPFGAVDTAPATSNSPRTLVRTNSGASTSRRFTGYDAFVDVEGDSRSAAAATTYDLSNGKILKKRRKGERAGSAFPDPSQGNHESLIEVFVALQDAGNESRFADADVSTDLPHPDTLATLREGPHEQGEMAYELVEGQVGIQRTKKSKSAIKALSLKRSLATLDDQAANPSRVKKAFGAITEEPREKEMPSAQDDSAFFEGGDLDLSSAKADLGTSSSSQSSEDSPIFAGLTLALMELKGPEPNAIKGIIESRGGVAIIDANEEELERADWIVVDYVEAPDRFTNSTDPRVVTVCWLELCIFAVTVLAPANRILDRPIPYACPVPGADKLKLHFSGFGPEEEPIMHHNRRFVKAIGATSTTLFDRTNTHLIVAALDADPTLTPSQLDGTMNPKIAKAGQWGVEIRSLSWLRKWARETADAATAKHGDAKGKGKARDWGREITNEMGTSEKGDAALEEDETLRGPLYDCVVFFSTKIDINRQHLAHIVEDLGGTAARQYSDAVTHFIHAGPKASDSYKDLKAAKKAGALIVHPRWVEECGRTASHASESDFPYTFDSRKGGQLFDMGMSMHASSPPRASPRTGKCPSKLSLGSPGAGKGEEEMRREKAQGALEWEEDHDGADKAASHSPSLEPRRRRSDTTATEVEGGFDGHQPQHPSPESHHVAPSADASRRPLVEPVTSSPPSLYRPAILPEPEVNDANSSDPFEIPPLRSETRPAQKETDPSKSALREQTSLLLAQLVEQPQGEQSRGSGRPRSALGKKKSSLTSAHASTTASPTTTTPSTVAVALPRAAPAQRAQQARLPGFPFDPSQATQDPYAEGDESMYVRYDNPAEAAAREQIRLALAAAGSGQGQGAAGAEAGGKGDGTGEEESIGARTRRARARRS